MKNFRLGLIAFALIWILLNLSWINYDSPGWSENRSPYGQIIAFSILITGLIYSIRHDRKNEEN